MTTAVGAEVDRAELLGELEREVGVMIGRIRRLLRERARNVHEELQSSTYLLLSWLDTHGPLRASEIAEAFGLPTWAHHRLEDRMAKTPERVEEFYSSLAKGLEARGRQEVEAVSKLLEADTGDTVVQS